MGIGGIAKDFASATGKINQSSVPPSMRTQTLLKASNYQGPDIKVGGTPSVNRYKIGANGIETVNRGHDATVKSACEAKGAIESHLNNMKDHISRVAKTVDGFRESGAFTNPNMGDGRALGLCFGAAAAGITGGGSLAMIACHTSEILDAINVRKSDKHKETKAQIIAKIEAKIRNLSQQNASIAGQGTDANVPESTPLQNIVDALDAGYGLEEIMFTQPENLPEYQEACTIEHHAQKESDQSRRVIEETAHKAGVGGGVEAIIDIDKTAGLGINASGIDAGDVCLTRLNLEGITKIAVNPNPLKELTCNKETSNAIAKTTIGTVYDIPPPLQTVAVATSM